MNTIQLLLQAARFAAEKHAGQTRKGATPEPYINHPIEVATLLSTVGKIDDVHVLRAGLLHDTVEDCDVSPNEIIELFGSVTAGYVLEVTDDKSLPKARRKELQIEHAPHLSHGAKLVKLADKISNCRDVIENPAIDWDRQRLRDYIIWGESVVAGLRGVNEHLEARFDEISRRARMELAF